MSADDRERTNAVWPKLVWAAPKWPLWCTVPALVRHMDLTGAGSHEKTIYVRMGLSNRKTL